MTVTVIATNNAGTVSSNATLSVIVTPVITPQPVSVTTNAGSMVVFTSGATGVPTPGLQWSKNGAPIPGETGSTLNIASAQGSDNGNYTLTATNAAGSSDQLEGHVDRHFHKLGRDPPSHPPTARPVCAMTRRCISR